MTETSTCISWFMLLAFKGSSSQCAISIWLHFPPFLRIVDGATAGLLVQDYGRCTIVDCDISGHKNAGVYVSKHGDPRLFDCLIHDNREQGVLVQEEGLGYLEACQVYGNTGSGVAVRSGGDPYLVACRREAFLLQSVCVGCAFIS